MHRTQRLMPKKSWFRSFSAEVTPHPRPHVRESLSRAFFSAGTSPDFMTLAEQHDKPVHLSGFAAAYSDQPFGAVGRTATFWRRASRIYFGYKSAQTRAAWLGHPEKHVKQDFWRKHHTWAGAEMYSLAVDLRGFYLKASLMVQLEVSVLYLQSATSPVHTTHTHTPCRLDSSLALVVILCQFQLASSCRVCMTRCACLPPVCLSLCALPQPDV